jgi:hypothetical protein
MTSSLRTQSRLRLLIGPAIALFSWVLYGLRVTLGVGPMYDSRGTQAPAIHYLVGALVVTVMVAIWIVARHDAASQQSG